MPTNSAQHDEPTGGGSTRMRDPDEDNMSLDGSQAKNNMRVQHDMRVRAKNILPIPVEGEASRRVGARRSASAPRARSETSVDTSSSSSRNTAQKAMMNSSCSSGDSRFIVREPPNPPFRVNDLLQQPESEDDDDSFAREPDGTTTFSDAEDADSDTSPNPSDNQENEEAPPESTGAVSTNNDNIWNMIPRDKNGQLTSVGSVKHATGTCTPCVFMSVGTSCKIGVQCDRCHLSHRSKKTRPCKGKRDRQKKAMDRVLEVFEESPYDFDVNNFHVPSSIRNTALEGKLKTELHTREAILREGQPEPSAASSSGNSTRMWL